MEIVGGQLAVLCDYRSPAVSGTGLPHFVDSRLHVPIKQISRLPAGQRVKKEGRRRRAGPRGRAKSRSTAEEDPRHAAGGGSIGQKIHDKV